MQFLASVAYGPDFHRQTHIHIHILQPSIRFQAEYQPHC